METILASLATYLVIDLISLAILYKFRRKFIYVIKYWFERLELRPVAYNTYNSYYSTPEVTEERGEDARVLSLYEDDDIDFEWGYSEEDEENRDE